MTAAKTKRATSLPDPKSGNSVYLWPFIGVNLAIFLWLLLGGGLDQSWARVTAKNGIIAASVPLLAIVLSNILGDQAKARLVFWRWHHPLPGCRVFTELMARDPRIDVPTLKSKLGRLPREPHAQNTLWYRLYDERRADPKIVAAHRTYLVTRDLASISAAFVALLPCSLLAAGAGPYTVSLGYAGLLSVQYVFTASAARNYGKRFVLTVLADESHTV
jgi:hypothetical protein